MVIKTMRTFAIFVFIIFMANVSAAEVVQIPLPELHGEYEATRRASFELPQTPKKVNQVTVQLRGVATVGELKCPVRPGPWPMKVLATMIDSSTGGQWVAGREMPNESGSFDFSETFRAHGAISPSWDFIMDGQGEVWLSGYTGFIVGWCSVILEPTVNVVEAFLVVDADFAVPVEPTTWGRVKNLYLSLSQ